MPPDRRPPDDPQEWLNRARSNLERAKADIRLDAVYLEDLCFDAQQAAEKAIKAVLLRRRIRFPHVHDIGTLLGLIEEHGDVVPAHIKEGARLTRFAVQTRYPTLAEPVTAEEYRKAVSLAEAVLTWAEEQVQNTP